MIYESLKKAALFLVPRRFLLRNEKALRKLIYQFNRGTDHECNICSAHIKRFIKLNNEELLCPKCGSTQRNRRFWQVIQSELKDNVSILDFSPSKCLHDKFKSLKSVHYVSTDFANEFIADKKYDITNINTPSESFDIVICYHILEHIENDSKAISELGRIIKKDGKCYIQTPFKEGEIYEDHSVTNPLDREKLFGQSDHLRIYSVDGLRKRIENLGFKTQVLEFGEDKYFGMHKAETIIILTK
jgi:SAM-dependent methyltransferase